MDYAGVNWSEIIQNAGIIGSLLLSACVFWRTEQAQRVSNLLDLTQQYRDAWDALNERPGLSRVLLRDVDVEQEPPTIEEEIFVSVHVFRLDAAYEAMRVGMFMRLRGLKQDAREFFSLPIPRAVWEKIKPLQNKRLVRFVDAAIGGQARNGFGL